MSSIDSRIVTMKFDNTSFQKGVTGTLDLLSKLKSAVTGMPTTAKGLDGITASAKKVDLTSVANQATGIGNAFNAMSVVAVTALATVTHAALNSAGQMAKSLTVAPIAEGLSEYETNLNSIQTIMANTGLEGQKGLNIVQGALDELNHYSDKTIYNFAEMARNIGTFTAAGVKLEPATEAIKGIANLAAVSGSSSQQASTAMYQLSQALAAGKVTLMDWNSVVNAGMGGQVLKDALMETARVHGVAVDDIIKKSGSFRDSISEGWVTGEILTETLQKFTGDLSRAQLQSMGYTEAQIDGIIKMGKTATDAATKVKTASGLINTLQETATSGWSKTWSLILGDFFEARQMFTAANDVLGGMLSDSAKQRNDMLKVWNKKGGRYALIDSVSNAFKALMSVITPIKDAFRDIFPPTTGARLYELTLMLKDFTKGLILSKPTMNAIQSIFRAIFGVLGVGIEVVKGVFRYFFSLFDLLSGGAGGLLQLSGSFAEIVAQLAEWILKGDYIAKFFDKIIAGRAALLGPIIDGFGEILKVLAGWVTTGAEVAIEAISTALAFLAPYLPMIADNLKAAGDAVQNYLVAGFEKLKPVLMEVKDAIETALGSLSGIGGNIGGAFGGLGSMFDIGDSAAKAADGIGKVKDALSGGVSSAASGAQTGLSAFGEFLKGFGGFLLKIGGAIGLGLAWLGEKLWEGVKFIFEGGGDALSSIGGFVADIVSGIGSAFSGISFGEVIVALNTALTAAIGGAFVRMLWKLGDVFKSMNTMFGGIGNVIGQLEGNLKSMQNNVRAEIIMKIAISLGLLAAAVYVLSTIDAAALGRSLGALAAMLLMLSMSMIILEKAMPEASSLKSAVQLGALGIAMIGLGAAMLLMAIALRVISNLDPEEIKTGLITLGGVLAGIIAATAILNKTGGAVSLIQASIAIGILAFSLTAFAAALKLYSALDTGMLMEGGLKIAGIIIGLGLAMRAFPATSAIGTAASLILVAIALRLLVGPLMQLATLSAGDSWQSVLTLGGALLVLAIGANALNTAMAGGAALILLAVGLKLLIPSLLAMAEMEWGTVLSALLKLTLVLGVLAVVGAIAGVGLLVLGAGMLLFGAGLALAGVGMLAFATGLTLLASAGAAASAVLISVINNFLEAIPGMMQRFGKAMIAFANMIAKAAPAYIRAGSAIIAAFLRAVIKNVPLMGKAIRAIISEGLKTFRMFIPDFIKTGFEILNAFMDGLMKNIGELTQKAVTIVVRFIDGITKSIDKIVAAGKRMIVALVKAIGGEIGRSASNLVADMKGMAGDMLDGLVNGIMDGVSRVGTAVANLAGKIPGPIKKLLGISSPSKLMRQYGEWTSEGLAIGIRDGAPQVEREADAMGRKALDVLTMSMNEAANALALDPNMSPVITPVLDLSKMANDAASIGSMLDTQPISATVSYSAAAALAAEQQETAEAESEYGGDGDVIFEQHLHSPTPLDRTTIYRTTRNQFSMAKEALKK